MARWRGTLKIKDLLTEEDDPETVRRVAGAVHDRLDRLRVGHYPHDIELDEICNEFAGIASDKRPSEEDFNGALDLLYDWGDDGYRLWIE